MKIRKKDKISIIISVILSIVILTVVFFVVPIFGILSYILTAVVAVSAIVVILFYVRQFMIHIERDAKPVESFLNSASEGHLDERINVTDENSFHSLVDNLNGMIENLETMSRSKNDFLSSMSHEIRTPMNAIIGMSQIARRKNNPAELHDCLQKIEENGSHLLGVINDILDFSKMDSGKLVLDEHLFSIAHDMGFISSMFKTKAQEKGLEFVIDINDIKNDGIVTDSLRLNQVLINFLSNAVKFTNSGGKITLTIREVYHVDTESIYAFSVEDTGIGIKPDEAARLFTPFSQANSGMARRYGGTGLGLVISKNIVELMGGEIELESRLGVGSTFSFTIRVPSQEKVDTIDSMKSEKNTAPDFSGYRILIADDVEINRDVAAAMLEDTGVEIEVATDGQVAFDMYYESPIGYYDLILMDMQMPVMDGCESTERIRSCEREDALTIKIVAMTANVMREDLQLAYDAGMDRHIGKPIDFAVAFEVISDVLKESD
ncbi:MAG: response regulator [Clostridiales Family XIII bacterium]|jgi:signal transduction histidine kinase/CheY-like chemotaxis protein|nr:response regulator [Clostridiales Family XIII bacterium]